MNIETSAGAVIFRRSEGKLLFLVIYSARNKVWGFPKGHIEEGETEKGAALREIKEETGLENLCFFYFFREEDVYKVKCNRGYFKGSIVEKHSVYFLCEANEESVIVDQEEISDYKWLELEEANELLDFDSLKVLLQKAERFVRSN